MPAAFDIATTVSAAVDVHGHEDLAEPDATDDSYDSDDTGIGKARDLDRDAATLVHEAEDAEVTPQPPTASSSSSTSAKSTSRKKRDKEGSRWHWNEARTAAKVQQHTELCPPAQRPAHFKKHMRHPGPAVKTKLSLAKHWVASTGWISLRDNGQSPQEEAIGFQEPGWTPTHSLPEFFGPPPHLQRLQTRQIPQPVSPPYANVPLPFHVPFPVPPYVPLPTHTLFSKPRPILNAARRIFGLFGGHSDNPDWKKNVHDPAVAAMEEARVKCKVPEARTYHRWGNFFCLTAGDSHGNGHIAPGAVLHGVINTAVLCALLSNVTFIQMAGFAAGVFVNWAPNLFDFYLTRTRLFYRSYTHLWRPFLNSIWTAWPPNLLPWPSGFCQLGLWLGSHLILWDCKLILESPPSTTIRIPSAAVFHSNIGIGPNDRRYSFTQHTAGGIFHAQRAEGAVDAVVDAVLNARGVLDAAGGVVDVGVATVADAGAATVADAGVATVADAGVATVADTGAIGGA
ncbi:hypothetical protein B0H16DRAFT_1732856 [Mycena metata]|uniref:Uncharacterized protein n=1 Tax=Mycena metata TaxID=1033252 RepID=A0AAD7I1Z8_9AGAR|nr:hypothetical protein B0H16DRAFT_1732856 [Mycena metata]